MGKCKRTRIEDEWHRGVASKSDCVFGLDQSLKGLGKPGASKWERRGGSIIACELGGLLSLSLTLGSREQREAKMMNCQRHHRVNRPLDLFVDFLSMRMCEKLKGDHRRQVNTKIWFNEVTLHDQSMTNCTGTNTNPISHTLLTKHAVYLFVDYLTSNN